MAHEVETMAWTNEVPWHNLGVEVSNDLTPVQMMEKAGVNWEVEEVESFIEFDGKMLPTGQKSLVRKTDAKILTNVGENWNPVQNADAFDFFTEFVLSGDMEMNTAGSLRGGQIVWALAKVKESFDVLKGDQVSSYLLFANPHLYGKSIDVRFTPVRAVCNNTLTMALSGKAKNGVRVGHRAKFDPEMVKDTMGLASEKFAKYKEMAQFLAGKKVTADALIQYYNDVFPHTSRTEDEKAVKKVTDLSRNAQICHAALENQPGAELGEGTWWSALNSVTYVTDHIQGRTADNRLHSQWFGQNQARKLIAANKAVEYAKAS